MEQVNINKTFTWTEKKENMLEDMAFCHFLETL